MRFLIYGFRVTGYSSKPAKPLNHCQGWPSCSLQRSDSLFSASQRVLGKPNTLLVEAKNKALESTEAQRRQSVGKKQEQETLPSIMRDGKQLGSQDPGCSSPSLKMWYLYVLLLQASALELGKRGAGWTLLGTEVDQKIFGKTNAAWHTFCLP